MRFELIDYQDQAAADVVDEIRSAADAYDRRGKLTAISLSAPTSAGKTVIAAAVIERLIFGHHEVAPNPDTTVLWITDNPSLNAQTLGKLVVASDRLDLLQLIPIDTQVDIPVLEPATVYFLNTQKLGRGARTFRAGDTRENDPWDTIGATIRARGGSFLLIIDEAHRGTSDTNGSEQTILSRLIDGTGQSGLPAPVVLGISATPKRFLDTIANARTVVPVNVDPDDVRRSGLVKSDVALQNPRESQPSDATLLEDATEMLGLYTERWAAYATAQGEPPVVPVMVVQLPSNVPDSRVAGVLDIIAGVNPALRGMAVAHALQEHTPLMFGSHTVRYVAPERIQDDPHVRVVLFKEALTTGWDCPRAEVMVSLRKAEDDTYITQLIGRMVRTPLARKPEADGFLDSVRVSLPFFNQVAVDKVIARLESGDSSVTSRVTVNPVDLERNTAVPVEAFDLVESLPSYTRPAATFRNEVARLNRMATLLEGNGILPGATRTARETVVAHLVAELARLSKEVQLTATDYEHVDYRTRTVNWLTGQITAVEDGSRRAAVRNVDDLFASAARRLGDAAAPWLLQNLVAGDDDADIPATKVRVAALAAQAGVRDRLDDAAGSLVAEWHRAHRGAVAELPDAVRGKFDTILEATTTPVLVSPILPERGWPAKPVEAGEDRWVKHLYVGPDGLYPEAFNTWEKRVLAAQVSRDDVVAWYRNPTAGKRALAVPYTDGGAPKTVYPDFLVVRSTAEGLVVDVLDPHDPSRSDTVSKWAGLAEFTATHGAQFGKVLAIIADADDNLVAVDLRTPAVGQAVRAAIGEAGVRAVFEAHGFRL